MRSTIATALLVVCLASSGCLSKLQSQQPPPEKWTTGFWYWNGQVGAPVPGLTLDELYCFVGNISGPMGRVGDSAWHAFGRLPENLPRAHEYWFVYRYGRQGVPDVAAAPVIGQEVEKLFRTAKQRHLNAVGVQFDIDSPTNALPQYAAFLRAVKKNLPAGTQISITALLDWFRDGTAIADVIDAADEFVPQFYDVDVRAFEQVGAIAKRIDAAVWAPKFNRFGKRFRIGISTFGRARLVPKEVSAWYRGITIYNDLTPLDIAMNPAFRLKTKTSEAGELVLTYSASRNVKIGYNPQFQSGDAIQFTMATPASVHAAVDGAKRTGKFFAGVLFFRWPNPNETLAMRPRDVLAAAGELPEKPPKPVAVETLDGKCAAVSCVDVYLTNVPVLAAEPLHYVVSSSIAFEYFLPQKGIPVRMSGADQLKLSLPAYAGRERLLLGRAVTAAPSHFSVSQE